MHCELAVPGLFAHKPPSRLPALELLLARGRRTGGEPLALEPWLARAFHAEEAAPGALTASAAGADTGDAHWMRADPVHLRLLRDRAVVVPGEALTFAPGEDAALRDALAPVLLARAWDERRWYARQDKPLTVSAAPALAWAGRDVEPQGATDPLLTEIQMLLHANPVNEAREARGEPAVNSLWFWGAGPLPGDLPHAAQASLLANDPVARGLGRACGVRCRPLTRSAADWLAHGPEDGRHLVVLDALRAPAALGDEAGFATALLALERDWFAPLLDALRAGRVGMTSVHVPDGAASFETIRGDLRRFWRRPRALARYA